MIEDNDVKFIIEVFEKSDLNENETKLYNKLLLIQERIDLLKEYQEKAQTLQEKIQKVTE